MSCKEIYGLSEVECSFTNEEKEKINEAIYILQLECNISFEYAKSMIESIAKEMKNSAEDIKKLGEHLRGLEQIPSYKNFRIIPSKNSENPYDRRYKAKRKW